MGIRDAWGTVVYDGQGGFKIINKDPTSTASCTQRHEDSHITVRKVSIDSGGVLVLGRL